MATKLLSKARTTKIGRTTVTAAKTKLTEGTWLILKPSAPQNLQPFGAGPFQVVKKIKRQVFLRGQQDLKVSVALTLKHFDLAPNLKISE